MSRIALALLLAGMCGLGYGWANEVRTSSDAAAHASLELTEARADADSVRKAFVFLNRFGVAFAKMQDYCREKEGAPLAMAAFLMKPDGTPDKVQFQCQERRTSL